MTCCDWPTFEAAFRHAWETKGAGPALIDWAKAERDWRRHHCTGGEAARMQLQALAREADYLWLQRAREAKLQMATRNRGARR